MLLTLGYGGLKLSFPVVHFLTSEWLFTDGWVGIWRIVTTANIAVFMVESTIPSSNMTFKTKNPIHDIVCIGVSTLRQKYHPLPLLSCQAPSLNLQTVQAAPFLGNPPHYIGYL